MQFVGCFIVNSKYGMQLGPGTYAAGATQMVVSGCQFVGNNTYDIYLAGCTETLISGNSMLSNGTNSVIEAAVYSAMSPGVNYITGCMIYKAISLAAGSSSQQVNNFTV